MSTLSNLGNTPSCTCAKCRNTRFSTRNLTGMKHPYGHTNALVTHLTSFRFAPAFFHFPRPWRISRWHFVLGVEEACGSRRVRLSVHDSSRVWDSMGRITRCLLSWMMTWSSATLGYQCCTLKQRDRGSNWQYLLTFWNCNFVEYCSCRYCNCEWSVDRICKAQSQVKVALTASLLLQVAGWHFGKQHAWWSPRGLRVCWVQLNI